MPSDSAAIVIACISGAVSLTVAGAGVWERGRRAKWQNAQEAALETQRSEQAKGLEEERSLQAKELEKQRSAQAKELEELRNRFESQREEKRRKAVADDVVRRYRDPLLTAAFQLQSRITNVVGRGFHGGDEPEWQEYFRTNTLYSVAEYFGWVEILRTEVQFLDLGGDEDNMNLAVRMERVRTAFSSLSRFNSFFCVFRGQQRAIGELMMVPVVGERSVAGRAHECLGYAEFVERLHEERFQRWLAPLEKDVERLRLLIRASEWDQLRGPRARLPEVQGALLDLLDLWDPNFVRFGKDDRKRILEPSARKT